MSTVRRSVADVTAAVAAGRSTVEQQVRQAVRAHSSLDLRAFTQVDVPTALATAEQADRRAADGELPLRGVVLAVKDNIDVRGFDTTAGTPALRTNRPTADAPAVRALREAGATILAKSNMHELAYGATSDNAVYGRVRHPLRPGLIVGGSSGGSAAAVAAGMATAALGTETGCSVRVPAALCGLVGFRPTVGAYPAGGVVPVSWTRDTIGVLAHSVDDVRVLDAVIRSAPPPPDPEPTALSGLRLGSPRRPFRQGMTAKLLAMFEGRLATLEEAGAQIVESDLPEGVDEAVAASGLPIALYETPHGVDRYLETHGLPLRFDEVAAQVASPDVARLLRPLANGGVTRAQYEAALGQRARLDRLMRDFLAAHQLDGLIVPTAPVTAPRLLADGHVDIDGTPTPAFPLLVRNADASSIVGWPAISLPAGADDQGLPFGIDLQFPSSADRALLDAAHAVEQVWRGRRGR
ncbi:amidase family protein [Streptomyces sp. NPDC050658]|uniref:amidase family protein n=1 Tax=unclassified Streptomyces TaxID=2593676 RepID=UPI003420161B